MPDGCKKYPVFRRKDAKVQRAQSKANPQLRCHPPAHRRYDFIVRMQTLSAGLALFVGEHATTYYGPQLAGALLSVLPLLVIYIFFQKYFIASVETSGMKD